MVDASVEGIDAGLLAISSSQPLIETGPHGCAHADGRRWIGMTISRLWSRVSTPHPTFSRVDNRERTRSRGAITFEAGQFHGATPGYVL